MKLQLKSKFPFRDRDQAARMLCEKLFHYRGLNPLVMGLSPEAVPMACLIARYLKGEADVLLVEKMVSPENPNFDTGGLGGRRRSLPSRPAVPKCGSHPISWKRKNEGSPTASRNAGSFIPPTGALSHPRTGS